MFKFWRHWREFYIVAVGISILVTSCLLYLGHVSFMPLVFQRMEALAYDLRMRLTLEDSNLDPIPPIFIVDIDERSLQREGQWPWPRYQLANLIERLHQAGAAAIALDMTFPEPEANPLDEIKQRLGENFVMDANLRQHYAQLDGDQYFAQHIKGKGVILGSLFHQTGTFQKGELPAIAVDWQINSEGLPTSLVMKGYTANLASLAAAASATGFLNIFPDDDGVIRSAPLVLEWNQQLYPSLALQVARQYLADEDQPIKLHTELVGKVAVISQIEFAGKTIQTDPTGQVTIPFLGKSGKFKLFSATDVLHQALPTSLEGAIVLVGTS
ncbi:MAG TPA: CHASE2 domain-containing protein, partial [Thiolinea sp.]|nr:CHASE2 domain-containing protein [Thiolinea sp.]